MKQSYMFLKLNSYQVVRFIRLIDNEKFFFFWPKTLEYLTQQNFNEAMLTLPGRKIFKIFFDRAFIELRQLKENDFFTAEDKQQFYMAYIHFCMKIQSYFFVKVNDEYLTKIKQPQITREKQLDSLKFQAKFIFK